MLSRSRTWALGTAASVQAHMLDVKRAIDAKLFQRDEGHSDRHPDGNPRRRNALQCAPMVTLRDEWSSARASQAPNHGTSGPSVARAPDSEPTPGSFAVKRPEAVQMGVGIREPPAKEGAPE